MPKGISYSDLGAFLRWGDSLDGAGPWLEQLKSDPEFGKQIIRDLQDKGITRELIRQWADFYGKNTGATPRFQQFKYRGEGLKRLFDQFPDDRSVPSVGA